MRRDDLPSGYDGWQALYCGRGSTAPCSGPAPVRAIKERKHGKLWQHDVTRFLSELHSEMRYHRVTHSYSSFSQRAVTFAHSQSKQTGQLLLTGRDTDCTNYTILTTSYKEEEAEEDEQLHCGGYPPPSQDCCFTVECEGGQMGKDCSLTITVINRGAMLRTVDGRVVGGVCRHNGYIATKFMGIQFSGVVTPGQSE